MKYIKRYEYSYEKDNKLYARNNPPKMPKYNVDDYIVVRFTPDMHEYPDEFSKILHVDNRAFTIDGDSPYLVEYLIKSKDDDNQSSWVREDEILRFMTPEEIMALKYNL